MDDSSSTPQKQQDPLPMSIDPTTTTSPLRRSRTRLADRLLEPEDSPEPAVPRRRAKAGRGVQAAVAAALPSPRKSRKPRRRSEPDVRDEKDATAEEAGKPRKRRNTVRSKKEKSNPVLPPPSIPFPPTEEEEGEEEEEENGGDLERVDQVISDLIMWKDVAKSTLWFGFGSLCLLSSCFSKGLNFSIFSAMSQLAIVFLGVSFVLNTICQRNQVEKKREFKLKEDDILHLAKLILPTLNLTISVTRELFSGEPSMTLKVAPFLLLGAEYGHFITIWRLCAIGFLISFTAPKLYSCYTEKINQRADRFTLWLLDIWCTCTHKKKLVVSALMAFWNLSSIKTRIYTAFMLLVLFRYLKQHVVQQLEKGEAQVAEEEQQQATVVAPREEKEPPATVVAGTEEMETAQALVVVRTEEMEPRQALVVSGEKRCAETR
ncbi:reticulon-like protein B17 [Arachis duranensis]|uniref:Reticulon-like protein n=1 Tax=Arachis duranensis TaxID=130453 RepID=A0A6P4BWD4_ARADU|nr:reticulon-like protein B17 [Arachis duranensis]